MQIIFTIILILSSSKSGSFFYKSLGFVFAFFNTTFKCVLTVIKMLNLKTFSFNNLKNDIKKNNNNIFDYFNPSY